MLFDLSACFIYLAYNGIKDYRFNPKQITKSIPIFSPAHFGPLE